MRPTRIISTVAVLLALALAGCSQADDDGGVATLDEDTNNSESSDDEAEEVDPEEAIKKYEECMEEHGVDLDDVGLSVVGPGDGAGRQTEEQSSDDPDPLSPAEQEAMEEALDECDSHLPTRELSPEDEAELRENALAYAQCMRDKGFDIPDPEVSGGGIAMEFDEDSDFDPEDPAFRAADEECMAEHVHVGAPGEAHAEESSS